MTLILGIESSCDETSAAVIENGRRILSNCIYTQIALHKPYGGVVPEIASRNHVLKLGEVVKGALEQSEKTLDEMDAVAVTCGPGLVGSLITGVSYAKGLALAKGKPLVGVNHIQGHIFANFLAHEELEPPFICLVASGGHSHIVEVLGYNDIRLVGATRDDAAGEAFDKAARALGLPYPGGPELEKLAKTGDSKAFKFPSGFNAGEHFDFSFSGLKTAVINDIHTAQQRGEDVPKADIAASFQAAVTEILISKTLRAAKTFGYSKVALAGGVAANETLRNGFEKTAKNNGISFFCPPKVLCTDNAAMIGCAGYYRFVENRLSDMSLNAMPALRLCE